MEHVLALLDRAMQEGVARPAAELTPLVEAASIMSRNLPMDASDRAALVRLRLQALRSRWLDHWSQNTTHILQEGAQWLTAQWPAASSTPSADVRLLAAFCMGCSLGMGLLAKLPAVTIDSSAPTTLETALGHSLTWTILSQGLTLDVDQAAACALVLLAGRTV